MSSGKKRPRPRPASASGPKPKPAPNAKAAPSATSAPKAKSNAKPKPGRITPPKQSDPPVRPPRVQVPDTGAGPRIVAASWWGTAVFAASALLAVVLAGLEAVAFVVSLGLFAAGCGLFFVAYAKGVARSRTSQLAVTSLFLMAGSAPRRVRRHLLGSFAVQVAVALATAIARPYTTLAFGTLVPLYGLALCGVWAARHGTFPPRADSLGPRRR